MRLKPVLFPCFGDCLGVSFIHLCVVVDVLDVMIFDVSIKRQPVWHGASYRILGSVALAAKSDKEKRGMRDLQSLA